ncbi:MAG: hypothetical protein IK091_06350 [Spirochaetales bacterium]|nr:hypothetical protein [Spirochaetales bacterium]
MRRIFVLLLLIIIMSPCFSTTPYMRQNDRCTVVDLASGAFLSHTTNSTYKGDTDVTGRRNDGYYYWPQNLAVVGLTNIRHEVASGGIVIDGKHYEANGPITVKAELLTNDWCYTLNGSSESKRPFGIDMFARGKPKKGANDVDVSGYSISLGYQPNATFGVDSITVPADVVVNYDSFWWDVCLVMDPLVDVSNDTATYNGQVYHLDRSNGYYTATIKFTISCDDSPDDNDTKEVFLLHLAGTYQSNDYVPTNMTSILTVTALPAATVLDISSILSTGNEPVKVATYGYTTNSIKNGNKNNKIYLFLSNQREAVNTTTFELTHVKNSNCKIPFTAILHSDSGYSSGQDLTVPSSGVDIEFDGTDFYTNNNNNTKSNYLIITAEETQDKQGDKYVRWHDSGYISIQLEEPADLSQLEGGFYESYIYVHVVKNT